MRVSASGAVRFAVPAVVLLVLWGPALALVVSSLHNTALPSFSLATLNGSAYAAALASTEIRQSFLLSLGIAVPVALLCSSVGWLIAAEIRTWGATAATLAGTSIFIPLLIPPNTLSLSLVQGMRMLGLNLGPLAIFIGHFMLYLAIGFIFHMTRMRQLPEERINAALNLGAAPLKIFREIYWTHEKNVFWAAALVVGALSIDEPTISYYLADTYRPLSVRITQMMQSSFDPVLHATAGIVFLITTGLIIAGGCIQWRTVSVGRG